MIESAVTLLPLPLSPTTLRVSPRAITIVTPSTARMKARLLREWK